MSCGLPCTWWLGGVPGAGPSIELTFTSRAGLRQEEPSQEDAAGQRGRSCLTLFQGLLLWPQKAANGSRLALVVRRLPVCASVFERLVGAREQMTFCVNAFFLGSGGLMIEKFVSRVFLDHRLDGNLHLPSQKLERSAQDAVGKMRSTVPFPAALHLMASPALLVKAAYTRGSLHGQHAC